MSMLRGGKARRVSFVLARKVDLIGPSAIGRSRRDDGRRHACAVQGQFDFSRQVDIIIESLLADLLPPFSLPGSVHPHLFASDMQ